jgi:hypothetical protein
MYLSILCGLDLTQQSLLMELQLLLQSQQVISTSAGPMLYVGSNAAEIANVEDPNLIQCVATINYVVSKVTSSTATSYQLITTTGGSTTLA